MRRLAEVAVALSALVLSPLARADDADAAQSETLIEEPPLACDGALCDTTNGATCTVGVPRGRSSGVAALVLSVVLATARRKTR